MSIFDWQALVRERVAEFGHRNWIVVADAAYPAHASAGIETIAVGSADVIGIAGKVLRVTQDAGHVSPIVYTDAELPFVDETGAPGVSEFREALRDLVKGYRHVALDHERIIEKLDTASSKFRVLIVKTRLTIPYTSVFIELECGYWSAAAEERMRAAKGKLA